MEAYQSYPTSKQVILLDMSLFVLDLLSPQKIKKNVLEDNLILEVPGALVSMLWSAMADTDPTSYAEKSILFEFIYAHLQGIKNNPFNQHSEDQMILDVVNADQSKLHDLASIAYERIFYEFAYIIEGATKEKSQDNENENRIFQNNLIRRYEPSVSLNVAEEYELQKSYRDKFELRAHPLYDLYFLQIYHAQTKGLAASPVLRRDLFALGNATFQALQEWKRDFYTKWTTPQDTEVSWERIKEVSKKIIKEEIRDELIGLTLSTFVPGAGVVLVASKIALKILPPILDGTEEVTKKPITETVIIILSIVLTISCLWNLLPQMVKLFQSLSPSQINPTNLPPPPQLLYTPTQITYPTTTPSLIAPTNITSSLVDVQVTPTVFSEISPNYCLYVVQPGDTLQSIASWFYVSENDIRNSDIRVSRGVFTLHQLVRVNTPCCTHVGINNGYSYFVQPKDNVFRLAINLSTSVEAIVSANNLGDSRYIQSGQMLCIPY
jgi:LysM repeat protein